VKASIRASATAAAGPICGLAATYVVCALTPWGRHLDLLAADGRFSTNHTVRMADQILLETISTATVLLALATLIVVGGLRGRWQLALRSTTAVLGALATAEVLKHLLPSEQEWDGRWRWLSPGSFPSGHAVIVTSITLAVLSVSSPAWRRRLVGPLVAGTAIAATATVTVGWHRPGDVVGSFFLATAWHRALGVRRPADLRLRAMLPRPAWSGLLSWRPAALWWVLACAIVLGAAAEGVLAGHEGRRAPFTYLVSLAVLLAGALITVARSARLRPAPVR
jgi:hypothetical protein